MYSAAEALEVLFGRVGWREQPTSPKVSLSDENKQNKSGRYFQDVHAAVSLQNILSNVEGMPDEETFNGRLSQLQEAAILAGLDGVFGTSDTVEQVVLFDGKDGESMMAGSPFVGYRIQVAKDIRYSVHLKSAALLFDGDDTLTLRCIHSTAGELWSKEVQVKANQEVVVAIDDLALYYSSPKYKGGSFYIGYHSETLHAKPIAYRNVRWARPLIFSYEPVEGSQDLSSLTLSQQTYGLNLELCSYRDYTEVIRRNASLFDTLIGLQLAASVVELLISSTRSNMTERLTKEQSLQLYNDLNLAYPSQDMPYTTGLKNRVRSEVDRLRNTFFPKPQPQIQTPCFT